MRVRLLSVVAAVAVIVPTVIANAQPAGAATFFSTYSVNSTADTTDAAGTGLCATQPPTTANPCTLRAAITEANSAPSPATITFNLPAGTAPTFSLSATNAALTISKPMTIIGAEAPPGSNAATTIVGGGKDRVFNVTAGCTATTPSVCTTIDGVVVKNGNPNGNGGGILVNTGATLNLTKSTLLANAASQGAGIENDGTATIAQSTISGNTASGKGGGVFDAGSLTMTDSTVDGNTAKGGGGIASSTTTTIAASTVTNNSSTNSNGGGLYRVGGSFTVTGSILAYNNSSSNRDCYGSPTLVGTNVIQSTTGCNPSGGTIIVVDPLIGSLANNGGPTLTRLPQTSPTKSPVLDRYGPPCATPTDQRGVTRPGGTACDVGAVEIPVLGVSTTLGTNVDTIGAGTGPVAQQQVPLANILPTPLTTQSAVINHSNIGFAVINHSDLGWAVINHSVINHSVINHSVINHSVINHSVINHSAAESILAGHLADPLLTIHLSDVPLQLPGGWSAFLSNTSAANAGLETLSLGSPVVEDPNGTPQNTTIMKMVEAAQVGLDQLDLSKVLGYEPLAALILSDIPMRSIPLSVPLETDTDQHRLQAWCTALYIAGKQDPCTALGIDTSATTADPAMPLAVALAGFSMDGVSLNSILVKDVAPFDAPKSQGWFKLMSLEKFAQNAPSTGIGTVAVSGLPSSWFANCPPNTTTLGQAGVAGCIVDTVSLFDLFTNSAALSFTNASGVQPLAIYTLGDLLQGFMPPDVQPWSNLDIANAQLQPYIHTPDAQVLTYILNVTVTGTAASTSAQLTLPNGFLVKPGTFTIDGGSPQPDPTVSGNVVTLQLGTLGIGTHTVDIGAWAGTHLGTATASANATAIAANLTATSNTAQKSVNVVESFENAGTSTCPSDFAACDEQPLSDGYVYTGHISTPTDRDIYTFTVPGGSTETRASIILSNLPADFDLVLYGPTDANLRGPTTETLNPVDDTQYSIYGANTSLAPDLQNDVPLTPPPGMGVVQVSAQRGTATERIDTGTLQPGDYAVQVSGYNGVTSADPYALRIRTDTESTAPCAAAPARSQPDVTNPLPDVSDYGTNQHVLILVPQHRLATTYGASANDAIAAAQAFATNVGGTIVAVDNEPTTQGLYAAWDANRCSPTAANNVVRDIGAQMDAVRNAHPDRNYDTVVVVGDDSMIPMARIVDRTQIANESSYGAQLQSVAGGTLTNNELSGSLGDGYYLTDNAYGTSAGIGVDDHELFVPDMAVGRLVETPTDISNAFNKYLDPSINGTLDPTTANSALVTGYDFMTDGAQGVATALQNNHKTVDSSLIGNGWTAQQLKDALLNVASAPGIVSLNNHFDQTRTLAGDSQTLVTTGDFAAKPGQLAQRLVFSMGCHSGLSVDDISIGQQLDWPQELTGSDQGAVYAGNTGYGYGDDQSVALSERLVGLYAQALNGSVNVGQALAYAKNQYLATTLALTPYDEKVIQEMNFYGIPLYRLPSSPAVSRNAALRNAPSNTTPLSTDPRTGLPIAPLTVDLAVGPTSGPNTLLRVPSTGGPAHYEVNGQTIDVQSRPIEPMTTVDVTQSGQQAHGVLITQLTSTDEAGFTPQYFRPAVGHSGTNQLLSGTADAVFPATIANVSRVRGGAAAQDLVVLAAGQARAPSGSTVTQRLFTHFGGVVEYSNSSDTTAPSIVHTQGEVVNSTAGFTVDTDSSAARVVVLYKPAGQTVWREVDLAPTAGGGIGGSTRWWGGGAMPAGATTAEFWVQAVDAAGNVGRSTDKVSGFEADTVQNQGSLAITVTGTASNGWYKSGPVSANIANTNGAAISYTIDGGASTGYNGQIDLFALGDGVHHIIATDASGGIAAADVSIDTTAPAVTAAIVPGTTLSQINPSTQQTWYGGPVNLVITGNDGVRGSGVGSITYNGTQVTNLTQSPDGTANTTVPVASSTAFSYFATDVAGNNSGTGAANVNIDTTPPQVTCTPPVPSTAWYNHDVKVPCTATDAGVGVSGSTSVTLTTNIASNPGASTATTNSQLFCDLLGNCASTGTFTFNIDTGVPTITITTPANGASYLNGQVVNADYSCGDALSGVASCVGTVAKGAPIDTTAGPHSFTVTATDNAGNVASRTVTYNTAYAICYLYNTTQAQSKTGTVVIKVQLWSKPNCQGTNLTSANIQLRALYLDSSPNELPNPNFPGNANSLYLFRYSNGQYVYNLDPTSPQQLPSGSHHLDFIVDPTNPPVYQAPFVLK
jgi:CSLREA domain-containing protein